MAPSLIVLTANMSLAAGTSDTFFIAEPLAGTWRLSDGYVVPYTSITASDTNYTTLTIQKASTSVFTAINSKVTGGTAFTDGTGITLTLAKAGASLDFAQGDLLKLDKADTGTGATLSCIFSFALQKTHQ